MARQISMATREELVQVLQQRYRSAVYGDKGRILDEFVAVSGYRRKHAIRLLRAQAGAAGMPDATRTCSRIYDGAVR